MTKINEPQPGQTLEQLRQRYEGLNETRIKVQAQRDAAHERLEQLRQSAIEQYGTDDIGKLREKLKLMKEENEEKRAAYEKSLDEIERQLREVERDADGNGET